MDQPTNEQKTFKKEKRTKSQGLSVSENVALHM